MTQEATPNQINVASGYGAITRPAPPTGESGVKQHVVNARENDAGLQATLARNVASLMEHPPDARLRMVEPMIAFLSGVNELSDDQVLHLQTLLEYHETLRSMVDAATDTAPGTAGGEDEEHG